MKALEAGREGEREEKKMGGFQFQLQLDFHTRNLPPAHSCFWSHLSERKKARNSEHVSQECIRIYTYTYTIYNKYKKSVSEYVLTVCNYV